MKRPAGFTLIELLIAAALLMLLLGAITALLGSTLQFSDAVGSSATRLAEINDVSGYLSDHVRGAARVFDDISFGSSNGTVECRLDDPDTPCFAILLPRGSDAGALNYDFLAYRVEPRSSFPSALKDDDAWADEQAQVISEYRRANVCSSCASVPTSVNVTDTERFLVMDRLVVTDASGDSFDPFEYDPTADEESLTLRFLTVQRVRGQVRYTPADGPYEVSIRRRN